MAMYAINKQGLHKRSNYDELIGTILDKNKQVRIEAPWRWATIIRNSPQVSNLLSTQSLLDVEELNKRIQTENIKQATVRDIVSKIGQPSPSVSYFDIADRSSSDKAEDWASGVESALEEHEEAKQKQKSDAEVLVRDALYHSQRQTEYLQGYADETTKRPGGNIKEVFKQVNELYKSGTLPADAEKHWKEIVKEYRYATKYKDIFKNKLVHKEMLKFLDAYNSYRAAQNLGVADRAAAVASSSAAAADPDI